ncbi:3-oxoacyl-[acyl-carrier-protein] reductase FabG [bacterium MnTg02]|nr:3-oxoacyl-[acyl-carrier-protein] reductase FabG [bacterium MnTg02]
MTAQESHALPPRSFPDLEGRSVLVTGASSGLGRHFAELLARAGARVALAARRESQLEIICAQIQDEGREAFPIRLDVTDASSVLSAVSEAAGRFGGIDILVNNAGVTITKPVLDHEEEDWDHVVDTNLKGAFLVARETGKIMRDGGRGGVIVNIASIIAFGVAKQLAAYAASKAGLVQLTKIMALELARYQIRVNALCPGYIETDLNRDFFATEAGQAMIKRIPQRRLGQPADLDGPLLLLCSDASAYMTGTTITVDGGHLIGST